MFWKEESNIHFFLFQRVQNRDILELLVKFPWRKELAIKSTTHTMKAKMFDITLLAIASIGTWSVWLGTQHNLPFPIPSILVLVEVGATAATAKMA